jgi:hypothetical protein
MAKVHITKRCILQELSLHDLYVDGLAHSQAKALWSSLAKLKHLREVLITLCSEEEEETDEQHFFLESVALLTQLK